MNKSPKAKNTTTASSELDQLAQHCRDWRKTKSNRFGPMPIDLQKRIAQLIKSGRYSKHRIMQTAKINCAKIKELAAKNFDDAPEFLSFTLVDKKPAPALSAQTSKIQQSRQVGECLTINSANGDSISVPINISESAIQNIIKLFLCCK